MAEDLIIALALDPPVRAQLAEACEPLGVRLRHARSVGEVADADAERALWVCTIDQLDQVRTRWALAPVIVMAPAADSRVAIEAMKRGVVDCLMPPLSRDALRSHLRDALRTAVDANDDELPERSLPGAEDGIIGHSPAMQQVYKQVGLVAPQEVAVLITGESGTGKEVIARALHGHSRRTTRPFLAINCAAIPDTLLESELFGHERGAFTGAHSRKSGKFEQAHGGTLFLDEIGDMPAATQAKLLRVLQDSSFQRVGGTELVQCDVRIITATHQPLEQLIASGRFREDLYYRLKVATIHLPPLREREVDAVLLAHYFVAQLNGQFGTRIRMFSPEAVRAMLTYPWPGNVRELENAIKASLIGARGGVFRVEFLPEHIRRPTAPGPAPSAAPMPAGRSDDDDPLAALAQRYVHNPSHHGNVDRAMADHLERVLVAAALNATNGQLQAAAELLGISRTTLRNRIRKHGIRTQTTASTD